jgi:D-3-phosphoglycerate dehydrogenase
MDMFLDELAQAVRGWGVDVLRGPPSVPGTVVELDDAQMARFAQADVAMFSSRSRCTSGMIESAPRLRAVVTPTIGVETVDLAAATRAGILVANGAVPENYISMSEATVMLILNLLYGLRTTERMLQRNLPHPLPHHLHARMLRGKAVGIAGFGQIGREVARRLAPFDVSLLIHSPHADPCTFPQGARQVDLKTLAGESDVVVLCMAVTASNRGMIDDGVLRAMKRTAYLVNVARGSAVDEPALVRVLQEGRIAGAALDTFAVEPLPAGHPLRSLDNVILTPHAVGHTQEGFAALRHAAQENLRLLLRGEFPLYCKNEDARPAWRERIQGMGDPYALQASFPPA